MSVILVLCRIVLAAVFGLAAIAKFADRPGSKKALLDFGLPTALAGPLSLLLPLAELLVASLLLFLRSAFWGGLGALFLLAAFVIAISVNLARGRSPDCHCFGQLHSEPVGWQTLARNVFLCVCAAGVFWLADEYGASVLGAASDLRRVLPVGAIIIIAAFAVIFLFQNWLLFHLFHQQGRLLKRIDALESAATQQTEPSPAPQVGLPVGAPAPSFELPNLAGEMIVLEHLRRLGKPLLLICSDPRCNPCNALLPEVARWERELATKITLALVSRGSVEANRSKALDLGLKTILLQQDREVAEMYYAQGTPSAVMINSNGTIGSSVTIGAQAIAHLVVHASGILPDTVIRSSNGHLKALQNLSIGQKAPSFTLGDLDKREIAFSNFMGCDILVLFWNPDCRFCKTMLPDLQEWEQDRPRGAPELLLVSSGTVESNRAMNLKATVLLDQTFSVATSFGASGTPSAVRVNSDGIINSPVAVGALAVFKLAGGPRPTTARALAHSSR